MINYSDLNKLLKDFIDGLRNVGCSYNQKELSAKTINDIDYVKGLYYYLEKNNIDYKTELQDLSIQCNWDLKTLLHEILEYPKVIPRVKKLDGTLHYVFKEPLKPKPLDRQVKYDLLLLTSKIKNEELKIKLNEEIEKGIHILFVTAELCSSNDLNEEERRKAGDIWMQFY